MHKRVRLESAQTGTPEGAAPPLPLAGEGWGGGAATSHAVRVERASPTRSASFDALRPPPQAGEVKRVGEATCASDIRPWHDPGLVLKLGAVGAGPEQVAQHL